MPYRDAAPPRMAQLVELVAREPALRERHLALRRENDVRSADIDALGERVAEAERAWFSSRAEVAGLREAYERESAILAAGIEEERAIAAELAQVVAARGELAAVTARAGEQLATTEGALGDEYRAVAEALRAQDTAIANLEVVLVTIDRAHHALATLAYHVHALSGATDLMQIFAQVAGHEPDAPLDSQVLQARIEAAYPYAVDQLEALAMAARRAQILGGQIVVPRKTSPVEDSRLVREAGDLVKRLEAMSLQVAAESKAAKARRAELALEQTAIAARFVSG